MATKLKSTITSDSRCTNVYQDHLLPLTKHAIFFRRRMPRHCIKYRRSDRHNGNRILTFKCSFPEARNLHHFAFNYPFTHSDLNDYLTRIQNKNFMHFCRTCIGYTAKKKSIDLLTITDWSNCHDFRNKKTICLTARVHPGESPASYVCQGFLDFITNELDQKASHLREKYAFQVIPMLNPDGVDIGNHRSNFLGYDLNRQWLNPDPDIHPTIFAAKRAFTRLAENTVVRSRVEIFIDVHAHCQQLNSFLYANYLSEESKNKKQMVLPILLSQFTEDYNLDQSRFSSNPTKDGTARQALQELFGAESLCYTLEVSVLGYEAKTKNKSVIFYDRDSYRRIGKNLALAIYRYSLLTAFDVENLLENYSLVAGNFDAFRVECHNSTYVLKQENAQEEISDEWDNQRRSAKS
uniref:Peptidase M14 carboxypeptidase A domain-containing protein n=1 Tax=Romanomermis culicivorax TaxID=13658 RepID=A0A915KME4_ROMCU